MFSPPSSHLFMGSSTTTRPHLLLFLRPLSFFLIFSALLSLCKSADSNSFSFNITLDSLRISLEKQEDFIIFSLIERARYPYNSFAYDPSYLKSNNYSLVENFIIETEAIQGKYGRYQNPEELPFFPHNKAVQASPSFKFPNILHPSASSTNVSKTIRDVYFNYLLPLITNKGDDGNYQQAAAADLFCLQALSKRIHYGRFVAEIKFRNSSSDYIHAIDAKNSEALAKLLTSKHVEEMVIERVKKKAEIFGKIITSEENIKEKQKANYKVDPLVVSNLYEKWVIPLTKQVEVNYLLSRLI